MGRKSVFLFVLWALISSCSQDLGDIDPEFLSYYSDFSANRNMEYMSIQLRDTSYVFKLSDIDRLTDHENLIIEKEHCCFSRFNVNSVGQSCIIINDTIIAFSATGEAIATSIQTGESSDFSPMCVSYKPHCNVACYHQEQEKHYVYLSEWNGKHRCFIEELSYDHREKRWHSELRQIINIEIDDSVRGSGNMDWIVDTDNKMIYTQTYKDGSARTASGLIYLQFQLPSLNQGSSITLTEDQILRKVEFPMIQITQDKMIYKGKLYVASGMGDSTPNLITIIDLDSFQLEEIIDINSYNTEPEGLLMYKDNLVVFYWGKNFCVQNKKSLFIHFNNNNCLSYPFSEIARIEYI